MLKIELRTLLFIGVVILVILLGVFLYTTNRDEWLSNLSGNLFAEGFGIILTVAVIEKILEEHRKKEKQRFKEIALRQLRRPLRNHFNVLFKMFKAATNSIPPNKPSQLRDLFDDNYFEQIGFLDISKPAPVKPSKSWTDYIAIDSKLFKEALNRTVEKYAVYFDLEMVDLMEQLIESDFTHICTNLQTLAYETKATSPPILLLAFREQARKHSQSFTKLVELHNLFFNNTEQEIIITNEMWNNDQPKFGESRFNIPTT